MRARQGVRDGGSQCSPRRSRAQGRTTPAPRPWHPDRPGYKAIEHAAVLVAGDLRDLGGVVAGSAIEASAGRFGLLVVSAVSATIRRKGNRGRRPGRSSVGVVLALIAVTAPGRRRRSGASAARCRPSARDARAPEADSEDNAIAFAKPI